MNVISSQTRTWMDAGIDMYDDADASTYGDADAALDVRPGAGTHRALEHARIWKYAKHCPLCQ